VTPSGARSQCRDLDCLRCSECPRVRDACMSCHYPLALRRLCCARAGGVSRVTPPLADSTVKELGKVKTERPDSQPPSSRSRHRCEKAEAGELASTNTDWPRNLNRGTVR